MYTCYIKYESVYYKKVGMQYKVPFWDLKELPYLHKQTAPIDSISN